MRYMHTQIRYVYTIRYKRALWLAKQLNWFGLSVTRIKAEIIASWQSKYKTSIRNQITMAAGMAWGGEGEERRPKV